MLREEGYEVVGEADDGQEAVELGGSLKPDLVIMDVKMARRDGNDAASEIASKRIAPIVVLTAFSQRELVERACDAGAMAYLVKPFSIAVSWSPSGTPRMRENRVRSLAEVGVTWRR